MGKFPGLPAGTLPHQIGNGMCWKIFIGTRKAEFSGSFGDSEHHRTHDPGSTNPGPRLWYQETQNWQKLALKYGLPEEIALYEAVIMACANSDAKSSADVARQSFERAKKIPKLKCLGRPRKRSKEKTVKQSQSFFCQQVDIHIQSNSSHMLIRPRWLLDAPWPFLLYASFVEGFSVQTVSSWSQFPRSQPTTWAVPEILPIQSGFVIVSWLVSTIFGQHWWSLPCQASLEHLQRLDRCCGTSWRFEVGRTHLCQDHWRRATTRSSDLHYDAWMRLHQLILRKVGFLLHWVFLELKAPQNRAINMSIYILHLAVHVRSLQSSVWQVSSY